MQIAMNAAFFCMVVCSTLLGNSRGFIRFPVRPRLSSTTHYAVRSFPFSQKYYENYMKRLNSRNQTLRDNAILNQTYPNLLSAPSNGGIRIITRPGISADSFTPPTRDDADDDADDDGTYDAYRRKHTNKKSKNFEVIHDFPTKFRDVGGYHNIKDELNQCIDLLKHPAKYAQYNVRVPKGLIFEGPPGNGKTLLAKALAGEAGVGFISVSGSQFQEKYVGVGSSRVRELFELAKKHVPCIVFIDEIDALGRARSTDGESSSAERDSTLNELLVELDGFKNATGIFVIGATNRADLLDPALVRPGRIDKRIFIGAPDAATRKEILDIHIQGKPFDASVVHLDDMVEYTQGLSCAQIENLVNEAMLNAIRANRTQMVVADMDATMNRIMVGWQPTEHQFTSNIIDHIAIHEMGHVVMGLMSKHHAKVSKVMINLYSPRSPGYTVFQPSNTDIHTREALFEHLMILLSGRIAEEVFYDVSVTTGAINDFEEALKLAERMVVYYGMGEHVVYPRNSEKYKEMIDDQVLTLLNDAYAYAEYFIQNAQDFIRETSEILKRDRIIRADELNRLLTTKYAHILEMSRDHDT